MMLGLLPAFPCLLLLSLLGSSSGSDDDGTVVLTTSGPIRGKRLQVCSSTVTAFLGIPYAEPPVGALCFQKPIPHQPWGQILEATSFGNDCLQSPLTGYPEAETWTPKNATVGGLPLPKHLSAPSPAQRYVPHDRLDPWRGVLLRCSLPRRL
ncbi:unnamed protein product [Natator depressus]